MADRVERELHALRIDWPPTPDLATAVEARVAARSTRWPWPRRARALAFAVAALLVLVAAGLAVPPARSALFDLLGLHGARVERREPPPAPRGRPGTLGSGLRLGQPTTLAHARSRLDIPLTAPASLGTPDAVWLKTRPTVQASLVYGRRPGIPPSPHTNASVLLTEFRAKVSPVIAKTIGSGARIERLELPGARAYLITGAHGFAWISPEGQVRFEDRRLAGTAVLVERNHVLLRAEGQLPHARAVALARELARG